MRNIDAEHLAWLDQVVEEIVDPDRVIVDPHHHFWHDFGYGEYLLDDLWRDAGSGHAVVATVYLECRSGYLKDGPEHLRPVGESEFVAAIAAESGDGAPGRPRVAALIGHADLRLGGRLDEVLDAHEEASRGLFRGVRHGGAAAPPDSGLAVALQGPEGLYADPAHRAGVRRLGERGHVYDTWHYYFQNSELLGLAAAAPETTIVLDHVGTPLGAGLWAGRRDEVFAQWRDDISTLAGCENLYVKLGGLAMSDVGFGWDERDRPPTSDEVAAAHAPYYEHTIECFGPERCMFESNFPVDKGSLSYQVYWNAMKKIVAGTSEDEKDRLFSGTATEVYSLTLPT